MTQQEFSERIKENWTAKLRPFYKDRFEFIDGMVSLEPSDATLVGTTGTWTVNISLPYSLHAGASIEVQLNNSLGANQAYTDLEQL